MRPTASHTENYPELKPGSGAIFALALHDGKDINQANDGRANGDDKK